MDDPNITMEEYIQLMADKARGHFEIDFPAIVYNDASTSNQNVSSEPTNIDIKPMDSIICTSNDTTPVEFDKNIKTNHNTPGNNTTYPEDLVKENRRTLVEYL
ncbi:hypothetical protein Tco_0610198 [Tanacetum coccineum]